MTTSMTPEQRTATAARAETTGPVTLMNGFIVPDGRDDAFEQMWRQSHEYFIAQPGFVSLRLHRALTADAPYRWINVANWDSEAAYRAAHSREEFRQVVTRPGWEEFPSVPILYEVVVSVG